MAKRESLVVAIEWAVRVSELRSLIEQASLTNLPDFEASLAELSKLVRTLQASQGGRPKKYSDSLVADVYHHVEEKRRLLRASGARQCGAQTAIRQIVRGVALGHWGPAKLLDNRRKIEATTESLYRMWDAARKRGKKK